MRTLKIVAALAAVLAIFGAGLAIGAKTNNYGAPTSILHVVTIKWKADSTQEQRTTALDGVKKMAAEVPGVKNVWIKATKVQPRDYNAAFAIEFEDKAAAERYVDHPAHREWEKTYLPIREQSTSHQITN